MSDMYEIELQLTVSGGPDRAEHFEQVVNAYADLEQVHDGLLDVSFGFTDRDDHAEVDVEVTVQAEDEDAAHVLATTSVRAAIRTAGGFTPNWDDRPPSTGTVYRVSRETIDRVVTA